MMIGRAHIQELELRKELEGGNTRPCFKAGNVNGRYHKTVEHLFYELGLPTTLVVGNSWKDCSLCVEPKETI